jgi:predicted metal-dependent peptidase
MGRGRVRLDLDREFRNAVAGFVSAADPGPRASYLRPPRVDDPSLILPGRAAVTRRIMVAMDTSPSMRGAQLTAAAQAVSTVADSRTMIVDYLSVDREAGPVRRLHRGGEVIVDRMSGGTDMRMALEEIDRSRPVGGVVITDGETPWPEVAPVTRNLLIVIVPPAGEPERVTRNRAYTTQMACPWARVTVLPA